MQTDDLCPGVSHTGPVEAAQLQLLVCEHMMADHVTVPEHGFVYVVTGMPWIVQVLIGAKLCTS